MVVKMFGGFSASYDGEALTFGRQRNSKFGQLFQLLMTRPGQGFSKEEIADSLYGQEEVEDLNASLNNTMFRLRKYLKASPLPSGDYLILDEGVMRFAGTVEVESDAWSFEKTALEFEKEQDRKKKAEICRTACEIYQGEFLPQLSSEQWVIEKSRNYQNQYARMMKYLLRYLKEEGDHGNVVRAAAYAARLNPYEEWEVWQVESLVAMGQHKEAEQIYQKLAERVQENGGFLSKRQQAWFREIGFRIRQPEGAEADISRCLMESVPAEGAYACAFPSFLDCFRMLKRVMAREGTLGFILFLCTILDTRGSKDREYCERQRAKLCASFRTCLRRGDIYTQYSDSQYLLLCMGAEKENVPEIGARIDMDFRRRNGGRGGIEYSFLDDGNVW